MARDKNKLSTIRDQVFVLSIAEGFFSSSILFALLELDVFASIGPGESTAQDLSIDLGVPADTLGRLLNAGVVVRLLESVDAGSYRLAPECRAVMLASAGEDYLGDWLTNMDMFRAALSHLDEAVRTAAPTVDPHAHIGSSTEETRDFILAMHNYAALRGRELADFLDTSSSRSLLDLGCGPGTYAYNLGLRNPSLDLYLLDLPGVLDVAREVRHRYDLVNKVHFLPVDVNSEEVPGQYDIVLVSNTLHMLGEVNSRALIRRLYDTVSDGGSLVIQAQYLQNHRMGGRWPVFLDLVQMCITEAGRNHTEAETRLWMEEAGFQTIEYTPMSLVNTNSFLRGYKV